MTNGGDRCKDYMNELEVRRKVRTGQVCVEDELIASEHYLAVAVE